MSTVAVILAAGSATYEDRDRELLLASTTITTTAPTAATTGAATTGAATTGAATTGAATTGAATAPTTVPLICRTVQPATEAALDEVIVVSGIVDLSEVLPETVTLLHNDAWQLGTATSLRVALDWCHRNGHQAAVIADGRTIGLTAQCWRSVADAPAAPIVTAVRAGRRGNPVRLAAEIWPSLAIDGDRDAFWIAERHPELVTEVACSDQSRTINTREELRRWG